MALGTSVFKQDFTSYDFTNGQALPRRTFNLYMGLCVFWGLALNAFVCLFFGDAITRMMFTISRGTYIVLWICYFVLVVGGIFLNTRSDKPVVSFIGYNMVILPLGFMLSTITTLYPAVTIGYAFFTTACVTAVMIILSTIKPSFFLGIGRTLFVGLIVAIIAEIISMFIFPGMLHALDWIIAIIFAGYIAFDYARAQMVPSTLDNAIDCACALYLDIVNLFVRLVQIFAHEN